MSVPQSSRLTRISMDQAPSMPQSALFAPKYMERVWGCCSGEKMTIEDVNNYVHEKYDQLKSESGVLYVYAKVVKTYSVTYVAYEKINGSDKAIV